MTTFAEIAQAMFELLQEDEKHQFLIENVTSTKETNHIIQYALSELDSDEQRSALNEISFSFSLEDYLGDWDSDELIELVMKKYADQVLPNWLENSSENIVTNILNTLNSSDIDKLFNASLNTSEASEFLGSVFTDHLGKLRQAILNAPSSEINHLLPAIIKQADLPELESAIGAHSIIKNVTDYYPLEEVLAQTPEWFTVENVKAIIETFGAEQQKQILGQTTTKPRVRLHTDGSVTLSEVHIASQHVVREVPVTEA